MLKTGPDFQEKHRDLLWKETLVKSCLFHLIGLKALLWYRHTNLNAQASKYFVYEYCLVGVFQNARKFSKMLFFLHVNPLKT